MNEKLQSGADKPRVICVLGPTAAGKTALAEQLAKRLDGELISVDSTLVYRGLNIGSAKPSAPHRLVDIRDPAEPYSVAEFYADAQREVGRIVASKRIPLLVGGSMLYFKALFEGLARLPAADTELRRQLQAEAAVQGWPYMHKLLAEVDPESAVRIHPNHSRRIARALEVYRQCGEPLSALQRRQAQDSQGLPVSQYQIVKLAICPADRKVLHQRIELRLQQMVNQGLVEEVRGLYQRGDLHRDLPSMRALGYRQLWAHFDGEHNLPQALELSLIATRQLAKRQLTWLRGWRDLKWIYTDSRGFAAGSPERLGQATENSLQLALKYIDQATT